MDLATLGKLYTAEGPFATIYLSTQSADENAAEMLETGWRNVLRDLESAGVDDATREALTAARGRHGDGGTRVLVASHGQVHLAMSLPEPPGREIVTVGPLPKLLPLVESLTLRVPHVVVLADRAGADVIAYTGASEPVESAAVDNQAWPLHKAHAGGWSSMRYEHNVENNWEAGARQVAALVERVARDVDARLVIASGDTRALELVAADLPAALRPRYRTIDGGGRHVDGGDDVVATQTVRTLADQVAADTAEVLDRFAEERGRHDRATDGVAATVAALRMSQVATLLLTDTLDAGRQVWFGPEPEHLALSEQELRDLGVDRPQQAELDDVVVRAAIGTGASIAFVAGDLEQSPREGVGALLRFSPAPA